MVRVDVAKWGQTLEDLRAASLGAPHQRTRERFQALYLIASGQFDATTCAIDVVMAASNVMSFNCRSMRW